MKAISLSIIVLVLFTTNYSVIPLKISKINNCFIDTSINNIVLLKDLSPVFGDLESSLINCEPDCRMTFYNVDTTEMVQLYFYPGRLKNECSFLKVSKTTPVKNKKIKILKIQHFVTNNGIKLFDKYNDILSHFDNLKIIKETKDSLKIVTYFGNMQKKDNCFSKSDEYNFSLYMSKYKFYKSELISYEFGFIYP